MEFRKVQIYLLDVHVPRSKEKLKFAISRLIELCKEKKNTKAWCTCKIVPFFSLLCLFFDVPVEQSTEFFARDYDNQVEDFTIACCIIIIRNLPWRIYPLIQRAVLSHPATHHKIECIHCRCAYRKTEGNLSVYPTPWEKTVCKS